MAARIAPLMSAALTAHPDTQAAGNVLAAWTHDDEAGAAARPIPKAHSIWELVLHMTGWKNETARRLAGAVACMPVEGDWPDIGEPTEARWKEALARLEAAHQALIAAVKALPEAKLYEPTNDTRSGPLGTGVPYYVLLHGIVQHDVYHAGQISLLKKAV
jgi:uncharacterized damage-inducible protein DinB